MAQNGHPVGQRLHLVHFMSDNDDGLAGVPHIAQDGKELFRLLGSQHGGRLVQNQNVRAPIEHLDNLHGLLLGDGHGINLLVGVHVEAIGVTDGLDLFRHGIHVQPSRLLQSQHNVLGGGEHIHQLEVLMNHTDAIAEGISGRADHRFLSIDEDLPLVREIDAGEHIHQGCLAAAVFSQQGEDLSFVNVQPDPVIGKDGAKAFGDVAHLHRGVLVFQRVHAPYLVYVAKGSAANGLCAALYSTEGEAPEVGASLSCRNFRMRYPAG